MKKQLTNRIANLLSIKSLVTLMVMVVFVVMAIQGRISEDVVMGVVTMVVAFYFGTQHEKHPSQSDEEKNT